MSYLGPTRYIESDHLEVVAFARRASSGAASARDRAVRLYYAVRDGFRYDPWAFSLEPEVLRASTTLASGSSFCIPKAILLAAAARAVGIPSRLAFADVRNHLASERLLAVMRTNLFAFHGMTELRIEGRWVKATPAFDIDLCQLFGVLPLEFDGRRDSTLHPFDRAGKLHMEYVVDRGSFADLPLDELTRVTHEHYPHLFDERGRLVGWAREARAAAAPDG
ncbi:MAG: transglutaminase domain-containing protein [Thermoanaerobaculia bacterium]